jgi:hypothetical protein
MMTEKIDARDARAQFSQRPPVVNDLQGRKQHAPDEFGYWAYCDNCGTRLQNFRCRLVCPKCGFFHSCSEP